MSVIEIVDYSFRLRRELVEMWRASFEQAVGVTDPHPIEEQLLYFDEKVLPENHVLVAVDPATSRVVGFIASTPEKIEQLYVHVSYQRQGIGSMLLNRAKRDSNGVLRLFTFAVNQRARQFYERHGFKAIRHGFEEQWQLEDVEYEWSAGMPLKGLPPLPGTEALILRTERLDLIPIAREHAPAMFEVLTDPALYAYVGGSPPDDVAALVRQYTFWEDRKSPDGAELWLNWVLRLKDRPQLIGHLQAGVLTNHADMAWFVGVPWQRRGYATEAAMALVGLLLDMGVQQIHAAIHPANAASVKVAERLGLHCTEEFIEGERLWKRNYRQRHGTLLEQADNLPIADSFSGGKGAGL